MQKTIAFVVQDCILIHQFVHQILKNLNFFLDYVSNDLKIFLKENSYNKIRFNVFFDSMEQYNAINSDKKRCLNTYVVNNFFELITLFFETQIRVFCNFFHDIANDFYIKAENNFFFLCNVLILF